jgi:hypothetical protein
VYLAEAAEAVRERLVQHRLSGRKTLWATILKQIAKQDSFEGHYADVILEVIDSFLKPLDGRSLISLWKQTETGMADEFEEECLAPDSVRRDLRMEFLSEMTNLAWEEAHDGT